MRAMKLNEIIISSTSANKFEVTVGIQMKLDAIARDGKTILALTDKMVLVKIGEHYAAVKEGVAIGWVELTDVLSIKGKTYQAIKMIFFIPEVRKTRAVGIFLIGLRRVLKHPVILGSDTYGGVLFDDGVKLVKGLRNSAITDVKILNLETGESRDLVDADLENKASRGLTLVFEDDDFPLTVDKGVFGRIFVLED